MKRLFKITASFLITAFLFFTVVTALHSHAPAKVSESCHVCQIAQSAKAATLKSAKISLTPHYRSLGSIDFWDDKSAQGCFELYRNRSPPSAS